LIGRTLLHYEITRRLGKGGMGEVYAARDTKLGRDVAVKILPAELSGDPEREARFQREARALASLQHPNVASVYGFEEADGIRFLVMELVEGEELGTRMQQGPIPVEEATALARQIAAGLEAAHDKGIVHRDLKPANIMRTPDGEVKILDFGLAQAWLGDDDGPGQSATSPTLTAAMTQAGAVLGTAAYMSPEQARGSGVDRRTDIWAFGVILFEMLTGRKLFQGETASDTLAAVLRAEPEWDDLPVAEAPAFCALIARCLQRDPKLRLRDIGEARIVLQDGGASGSHPSFSILDHPATAPAPARARLPVLPLAAAALVLLAAGALAGWKVLATQEPPPVLHAMILPTSETDFDLRSASPGPAALSPDGRMVAFTASDAEGNTRLYLRHLDKGEAVALSGTERAAYPFWSPDSRFIGFFDMGQERLRKVAVAGGPPVSICPARNGKGGTWNEDDVILFAPDYNTVIHRVPAVGGEPMPLTVRDVQHDSHRHPRFLPGGREFLFIARHGDGTADNDVFLASLDTTVAPRLIGLSQGHAEYAQGHLLTVREGVLMATPFTPDRQEAREGGTPLVENLLLLDGTAAGVFTVSTGGMLVYQTGGSALAGTMLSWLEVEDGGQKVLGEAGQLYHPKIAPDGTRAVVEVRGLSNEGTDLWLVDLESGLRTRFTFAQGNEIRPVWSPDGEYLFYTSATEGAFSIIQQPVEGQGGAAILLESARYIAATAIFPGNQEILIDFEREDGDFDMRRLRLDAGGEPEVVAASSDGNLGGGVLSPDGRWIAYHTETAAGWDVFVIPSGGGARKWQVTTDGAVYPLWSTDGSEIWSSPFDGRIRAYAVDGSGDTFHVGASRTVVATEVPDATGSYYDRHPDGARILQTAPDPSFQVDASALHLVTDWRRGLVQ